MSRDPSRSPPGDPPSVRITVEVELEINRLVDSLQMGDADRMSIADSCAASARCRRCRAASTSR